MPSPDILTVAADPKFQALPQSDQHAILGHFDPSFAALPEEDKPGVIESLQRHALTRPDLVSPAPVPRPVVNMRMSPLGKGYEGPGAHDIPGSFEGHPENIGEWPVAGPGQVGAGVRDITRGEIARGGHEVIAGAGNTMMPFTPFVAVAAPATTARAISGGYIGGRGAEAGARLINLSPEQTQLAGDVGNLIAGGVAAEPAPFIRTTGRIMTARPRVALRNLGERMRNFGLEPTAEPEPVPIRPAEPTGRYRYRPGEVPRDVIRPKLLTEESRGAEPDIIDAEFEDMPAHPVRGLLPEPEKPFVRPVISRPYRLTNLEPEDVNAPNPRVLARHQGIRTTPAGMLPEYHASSDAAYLNPEFDLPPVKIELRPGTRLQASREFAERNSVDVPKWRRVAEAKAQAVIDEAERQAEQRALNRELAKGAPRPVKVSKARVATPAAEEDLTPILEKSLELARKKKR
jgi:hypothetical protein